MTETGAPPIPVVIPLLNPNEPEGLLAALHVSEGQAVRRGDPLFTLETTKSTAEVEAEGDGYITGLRLAQGRQVRAGEVFCYLAAAPGETPPDAGGGNPAAPQAEPAGEAGPLPAGLRITRPALALARRLGVELDRLPLGALVTESAVQALAGAAAPSEARAAAPVISKAAPFDPAALVIYGGGGHGKALIDLVRLLGVYRIVGVIDDGLPAGSLLMGAPVLGGAAALEGLYAQGVRLAINAVGGIGSLHTRLRVFEILAEAGFACPAVAHPSAVVEASAALAAGVQVFAHAYVGSEARIGYGAIVNTGAILSHDCILGDYVNISPGAILAGEVQVGEGALVGMGATVNLRVRVGARVRIGNGATVKADVPDNTIVRAGTIWPE